jgi:hypothetical protein
MRLSRFAVCPGGGPVDAGSLPLGATSSGSGRRGQQISAAGPVGNLAQPPLRRTPSARRRRGPAAPPRRPRTGPARGGAGRRAAAGSRPCRPPGAPAWSAPSAGTTRVATSPRVSRRSMNAGVGTLPPAVPRAGRLRPGRRSSRRSGMGSRPGTDRPGSRGTGRRGGGGPAAPPRVRRWRRPRWRRLSPGILLRCRPRAGGPGCPRLGRPVPAAQALVRDRISGRSPVR